MRTIARIKWVRLIGEILIGAALVIGFMWIFGQAVLQESFKITPPTAEELAEDPSLVVYTEGHGK